jgi:hypothetical protein
LQRERERVKAKEESGKMARFVNKTAMKIDTKIIIIIFKK